MRRFIAIIAVLTVCSGGALAADPPRYRAWSPPADPKQEMVEELRRLIDDASRARAADPRFLQDLRSLADRYGNPWPVSLIAEDFRDGRYTLDPQWRIVSGSFTVDPQYGLRNSVAAPQQQAEPQRQEKVSREELALRLFGQLLNKGSKREVSNAAAPPPPPAVPGEITLDKQVTNAFSMTATLHMEAGSGPLTLAMIQGRDTGYFVVTGESDAMQLQRRGASGGVALANAVVALADNADHELRWTRTASGEMVVSVDGQEIMRATDTGFRDAWRGVTLINARGTLSLRSLHVSGAR